MEELKINFVAILVVTVANFFFGFLWYTVLFGKAWGTELGLDMSRKPTGGEMAKGMVIGVIGNFFMAFVLAHNNAAWGFVPGIDIMSTTGRVANAAIFTWLGFYLPVDLNRVGWERASWKLFGINTVYHLLCLVIAASILYLMG